MEFSNSIEDDCTRHLKSLFIIDISASVRQNQQTAMCVRRRLRSAWTSAQSDQSLRCPHEESLDYYLPNECTGKTDQTGRIPEYPG